MNKVLPLSFLSILLFNCATSEELIEDSYYPFTTEIESRLENGNVSLSDIQFYSSDLIFLERVILSDTVATTKGEVILENGEYKNIVVIRQHTPGIYIKSLGDDTVSISFEQGNEINFMKNEIGNFILAPTNSSISAPKIYYDGQMYSLRLGGTVEIPIVINGVNYHSRATSYYRLPNRVNDIKLVLKKSEFDKIDQDLRVVDGLRIQN